METRILVFAQRTDADAAVAKITGNMNLQGSTFIYAVPAVLADGRWYVPYPGDAAWLAGASGFTVAEGLGRVAVGEIVPDRPFVPQSVAMAQARAVMLGMPSPAGTPGRTLFDDVDDALHAAGGVDLQFWEYSNFVTRGGQLVNLMAAKFGLTPSQLDQLFIAADKITV